AGPLMSHSAREKRWAVTAHVHHVPSDYVGFESCTALRHAATRVAHAGLSGAAFAAPPDPRRNSQPSDCDRGGSRRVPGAPVPPESFTPRIRICITADVHLAAPGGTQRRSRRILSP